MYSMKYAMGKVMETVYNENDASRFIWGRGKFFFRFIFFLYITNNIVFRIHHQLFGSRSWDVSAYITSDGDKPDTRALIKGSALAVLDLDGLLVE